jgi:hypothetical protein
MTTNQDDKDFHEAAVKKAKYLANILNEKSRKTLKNETQGMRGMVYQLLASYLLAHCFLYLEDEEELKGLLVEECANEAKRMSQDKNRIMVEH